MIIIIIISTQEVSCRVVSNRRSKKSKSDTSSYRRRYNILCWLLVACWLMVVGGNSVGKGVTSLMNLRPDSIRFDSMRTITIRKERLVFLLSFFRLDSHPDLRIINNIIIIHINKQHPCCFCFCSLLWVAALY